MKQFILVILLALSTQALLAQATGYRGNRFALKTNLINGIRPVSGALDFEMVTGRRTSVTIGIARHTV